MQSFTREWPKTMNAVLVKCVVYTCLCKYEELTDSEWFEKATYKTRTTYIHPRRATAVHVWSLDNARK